MKDYTQAQLERGRPTVGVRYAVEFALEKLYADQSHSLHEELVDGLTYEELMGALLLARDLVDEAEQRERMSADEDEDDLFDE